jgi:hypothetical protein
VSNRIVIVIDWCPSHSWTWRIGTPAITSCEANECRMSCQRMRRSPARRQTNWNLS